MSSLTCEEMKVLLRQEEVVGRLYGMYKNIHYAGITKLADGRYAFQISGHSDDISDTLTEIEINGKRIPVVVRKAPGPARALTAGGQTDDSESDGA